MISKPQRQIIVLILDTDSQQYLFESDVDSYKLLSFQYNPSFDPWDNLALGRFLYQKLQNKIINTDLQFVSMLQEENFKDLLGLINQSQVVLTEHNMKCFYLETNKLSMLNNIQLISLNNHQLVTQINFFNQTDKTIIDKFLIKKVQDTTPKKTYCILEDEPNSDTSLKHIYQALFQGIYQEQNEVWTYHKVFKGEYPQEKEFDTIQSFVITGSSLTAYIKEPWYDQYSSFLNKVITSKKRILGTCFGHQIIAQFFGGSTAQLPHIPKEYHNYYGVKNVKYVDSGNVLQVFVMHGDNVTFLPTNTKLLMTSDYCPIQAYQGPNIVGLQFHPEFNIPFIKFLMRKDPNFEELIKKFDSSQTEYNQSSMIIRDMCVAFMKSGKLFGFAQQKL